MEHWTLQAVYRRTKLTNVKVYISLQKAGMENGMTRGREEEKERGNAMHFIKWPAKTTEKTRGEGRIQQKLDRYTENDGGGRGS